MSGQFPFVLDELSIAAREARKATRSSSSVDLAGSSDRNIAQ
jgi:hypothetical protein